MLRIIILLKPTWQAQKRKGEGGWTFSTPSYDADQCHLRRVQTS